MSRNREINTEDLPQTQKADINLDSPIIHGEKFEDVVGDVRKKSQFFDDLLFNEEPVTIRIETTSGNDKYPETYVPVQVNGVGAEVLFDGKWISATWLPINMEITTKRKYVEVLARSNRDSISTMHDDATVERPQNKITRRGSSSYPVTIIEDKNPRGHAWLSAIRASH